MNSRILLPCTLLAIACMEPVAPAIEQRAAFDVITRTSTTGIPIVIVDGLDACGPAAINDAGAIAGTCGAYPFEHPFVRFPGADRIKLDIRGQATDINNRGDVVGYRWTGTGGLQAFIWRPGSRARDLPTPGSPDSRAFAINDRGAVVGFTTDAHYNVAPFKWTQELGLAVLKPTGANLPWYYYGYMVAKDITNGGRVVGQATLPFGETPVYWLPSGRFTDLADPVGPWYEAISVQAINERNEILANVADPETDSTYILLWGPDRGILTIAPGSYRRGATGINDRGVIAGTYQTGGGMQGGPNHAFVWNRGTTVDLGTLGGQNSYARGINERGWVLGVAEDAENRTHVVIWRTR